MSQPAADPHDLMPIQVLRTMQIIAGALLMAVVVFTAIVVFLVVIQNHGQGLQGPARQPVITFWAGAMALIVIPLSFFVPSMIVRKPLHEIMTGTWQPPAQTIPMYSFDSVSSKLLFVRQTTLIVGLGLLEGVGFMANIAYMTEGQSVALGITGIVILFMLARFPTAKRTRAWILAQADEIQRLRQDEKV